ncbi:hypothetical protein TRIP_B200419 [uncultured Desulfatiglans sp.]|nr:hypothetical protein TRIP_B200419 [uncultured Desulfatiglans sp.]
MLKDATVEKDDQKAAHEGFPSALQEQTRWVAPANSAKDISRGKRRCQANGALYKRLKRIISLIMAWVQSPQHQRSRAWEA